MSKRYQKKSATKKKRHKSGGPSRSTLGQSHSQGIMGSMVSGFRRAVGSETSREKPGGSLLWTAVLVTAAIAVVAWSFAR